jgi:hypothetical protein
MGHLLEADLPRFRFLSCAKVELAREWNSGHPPNMLDLPDDWPPTYHARSIHSLRSTLNLYVNETHDSSPPFEIN